MFFIVNTVDGAGLYEYHYSLATGMLKSKVLLLLVFFAWFLYVRKYVAYVSNVILNPHYTFLQLYNQIEKPKKLRLFLIVEVWLLILVLLYAVFISFVGFEQHLYLPVLLVICYLLLLWVMAAKWHVYLLAKPYKRTIFSLQKIARNFRSPVSFQFTLIRFVATKERMIWAAIKIFTCGLLYLIARNNTLADYDTSMSFLFFNFGILANGVLIYRIREFEETYLSFYRGLPVSLIKRFLQHSLTYFILSIPEFVTTISLVPVHLHYADATDFILCSFSLLLLMNSITFVENFEMKEYVTVLLSVFCVQCIFLMTIGFVFLYLTFFILATALFLRGYYTFETNA